jgi:uncharacterized protein YkwD
MCLHTMRALIVTLLALALVGSHAAAAFAEPAAGNGQFAQRVLELTNAERQKNGLAPLVMNDSLTLAAQSYTEVLASGDCFAHTCGPEPDFSSRIQGTGYVGWSALAENIAAGYPTPESVVAGWMASPGHRQNILTPEFTELGVGVANCAGEFGTYWTEEFGAR